MKDWKYNVIALAFVCAIVLALYFILVHTVFSKSVLVNVNIQGEVYSLLPEDQAKELIAKEASSLLPAYLDVKLADTEFSVATADLNPKIDISDVTGFGKSGDIIKIISDSFAILTGHVVDNEKIKFIVDPTAVLNEIPYQQTENEVAYISGNLVKNCQNQSYLLNYNKDFVATSINEAILNKQSLYLDLANIVTDQTQAQVVAYCQDYLAETKQLNNLVSEDITWEDYLDYDLSSASNTHLVLKTGNDAALRSLFQGLATKLHLDSNPGAYIIKDNNLYLYHMYESGRDLNIDQTMANLNSWLANPKSTAEILTYTITDPPLLSSGYKIINLTNKIGEGTSRLDLIRDGVTNVRVHNSQIALEALDLFLLEPGEEFSFYQDTGIASHQIYGALGVCNASTTVFRMALMAGFPITDRSPHTAYILSYEYPTYPINNVEATFFGGPVVDLKFVNDLNYPVLLKVTIDRSANDGYQYHTVTAYTSPDAPIRYVELTDFKKWDVISEHQFKSSFTRKIWQDADKTILLKADTFSANYY